MADRTDPVLVLTGAPGVGKTTTARLLASGSERAVHLESDSFFHFIRTGYLQAAGHAVADAVLRAPLALCVSRAADRDASLFTDAAVVEQLWRDFADLGTLERHAIDCDGREPGEIAETVTRRLPDRLLAV